MLIFYSSTGSDPMLLDSADRLREFDREFHKFLRSSSLHASFPAVTNTNPEPYAELLGGLRVVKSQGTTQLCLSADRWLELRGSAQELLLLAKALSGLEDGSHHHWYTSPLSLIIEADDWRAGCKSEESP
jgi:hypothetical protein